MSLEPLTCTKYKRERYNTMIAIKVAAFSVSFFPFLLWWFFALSRPGKPAAPAVVDKKPRPRPEPVTPAQPAAREMVPGSVDFYYSRLDELYHDLQAAREIEDAARGKVNNNNQLNQYGAVVSQKNVEKALCMLYAAEKRRRTIENEIVRTLKTIEKAGA